MGVITEACIPGTQVIYQCVPDMPEEHGFVVGIVRVGYVHCRFWRPDSNELRTIATSEMVPVSNLTLQNTRSQHLVNKVMRDLGYDTEVSEYTGRITPMLEQCATIEHNQWSKWMSHVLRKGSENDNGDLVLSKGLVEAWQRQIETPYDKLTIYEQDTDRRQIVELLDGVLYQYFDMPEEK